MDVSWRLSALLARDAGQDAETPGAQAVMAVFTLTCVPPFRLDLTVWVLRRLPINQMDRWDGKTYRRVLMVGDTPVQVAVTQAGSVRAPKLIATTRGARLGIRTREALISKLDK